MGRKQIISKLHKWKYVVCQMVMSTKRKSIGKVVSLGWRQGNHHWERNFWVKTWSKWEISGGRTFQAKQIPNGKALRLVCPGMLQEHGGAEGTKLRVIEMRSSFPLPLSCNIGVWTQSLMFPRQMLYCLSLASTKTLSLLREVGKVQRHC
jgi:hypothetical protein